MGVAFDVIPRALRGRFVAEWENRRDEAAKEAERLQGEIFSAIQEGRMEEYVPFTGQTAGSFTKSSRRQRSSVD